MNPKISIIANFYNSKRFIPKLYKSILNQTYTNWELICIDDCSPQNDHDLLQKLTHKGGVSDKVTIIRNNVNLGISKSKKIGIDNATGDYITFIDGDDWFAPQALEKMIIPAINHDLDIVIMNNYKILPIFGYRKKMKSNTTKYNVPIIYPESFDEFYINFFGCNIFATNSYWGKLYKTSTITNSNINYPINDTYEDNIFNFRLFPSIKKMMFIDYFGYYWRWGGITSGKKNSIYNEFRFINILNNFAVERIEAINQYNYIKALKWLLIEVKNVLKVNITYLARYAPNKNEVISIKSHLKQTLEHPIYSELKKLNLLYPKSKNDTFINLIINKDVDGIYDFCHKIYLDNRMKLLIRKIIHKILYLI